MRKKNVQACCAAFLLWGTVEPAGAIAQPLGQAAAAPARREAVPAHDLLPLIDLHGHSGHSSGRSSPIGGYVRFYVERVPNDGNGARDYNLEARGWLQRWLTGRNYARILRARLTVNRADVVTSSVTLASASQASNRRQGEVWETDVGSRQFMTPLFRVDPGATASVEVSLSATRSVDADIAGNILNLVEQAARLVAPNPAPLVTDLTSERITRASTFIDTSISSLFGESIAERTAADISVSDWSHHAGDYVAAVAASFPMGRRMRETAAQVPVGEWQVRTTEPLVSVFSSLLLHASLQRADHLEGQHCFDVPEPSASNPPGKPPAAAPQVLTGAPQNACVAFVGLTPTRVLGLPVGDNTSLGEDLRGNEGIAAALQRYHTAPDKDRVRASVATELCMLLTDRAERLGLNGYDTAAAIWAYAWHGSGGTEVMRQLWDDPRCTMARLAQRLGLQWTPEPDVPITEPSGAANQNPVGPSSADTGDLVDDGERPR